MADGADRIAFVFPGQGSQAVGMGADVYDASPAARAIYALADRALGFSLSKLCFEGPEERLRETINTQPALVATSLALLAALQEAAGAPFSAVSAPELRTPMMPGFVAGHSVGEYAALVAAGALDVTDALVLVRERGRLMHEESTRVPSGMAAVLGLDADTLDAVCTQATEETLASLGGEATVPGAHPGLGRVVVANDNAPGQIVISGERRALDRAMDLARERGAKRVLPLVVSGAFHSPVLIPAAEGLAPAIEAAPIRDAAIPLVGNISARPLTLAADLKSELARQIESPVQWTQTVVYMAERGVTTFVEIGAGQVLAGLIKRVAKGATIVNVGSAGEVAPAAESLRAMLAR